SEEDKEVIKSGDISRISSRVMGIPEAPTVVVVSDIQSFQKSFSPQAAINLIPTIHPNLVVQPTIHPNLVVHPTIHPNLVVQPAIQPGQGMAPQGIYYNPQTGTYHYY